MNEENKEKMKDIETQLAAEGITPEDKMDLMQQKITLMEADQGTEEMSSHDLIQAGLLKGHKQAAEGGLLEEGQEDPHEGLSAHENIKAGLAVRG